MTLGAYNYGTYGGYGNYGGYQNFGPWNNSAPGYQGNIAEARVDSSPFGFRNGLGLLSFRPTEGYTLDQNRNGRYDRGNDGVLVFDTNRDGKYNKSDVQSTNDMMRAARGDYDFNNDGKVGILEKMRGQSLRKQYQKLDKNRDGVLSTQEIQAGGGRVWKDSDRNGNISNHELHSAYRMPNSNGWGPSQRLDFVNPYNQTSHTSNNWGWNPPSPFGPCGGGSFYPGGYGHGGFPGFGY